jgi:alkyl hydroperoxide reductase subunit D
MTIEQIRDSLPDYAKDVRLNLGSVLTPEGAPDLTEAQIYEVALASAYAAKNNAVVEALLAEGKLSDVQVNAAKAAATIMGMNNIYYRFVHLVSDKEYGKLPAKLRMNVIAQSGVEKLNFELMSLAVSAINGCGMCIDAHVKELEKHGLSQLGVQSAIRIAAVVNSAAAALYCA